METPIESHFIWVLKQADRAKKSIVKAELSVTRLRNDKMVLKEFSQSAYQRDRKAVWLNVAGQTLRFEEQKLRLQKLRVWLKANDVPEKESVLVAVENQFERMSLITALLSIGQPVIIFDPGGTQYETENILSDCEFSAVIAERSIYERLDFRNYEIPFLRVSKARANAGVFGRLLGKKTANEQETEWPSLSDIEQAPEFLEESTFVEISKMDLAYVIFTSGTTSKPKGVEIEFGAMLSQLATLRAQYELNVDSRILNTLPLHHVDGFIQGPVVSWFVGATLYRPCTFSAVHLDTYLSSIYRERISHMIAVPTMLSIIHRLGREWRENFRAPDFKFIVSCAGHLEASLWESFESYFQTTIVNMYGLTETTTSALFCGPDKMTRRRGTLGKPVNCEIKIVDENGQTVPVGNTGELLIHTPQVMRGYHKEPGPTSKILQDGWLASGDLVRQLETGHIALVGRKKNQIISGGRNISPEEVAEVLNLHLDVSESVVLGQLDSDWGESVGALVTCSNTKIGATDLVAWCRQRLSEFKVPRNIFIVEELAKGPSGKILMEEARDLFEIQVQRLITDSLKNDTIEGKVLAIASNVFRVLQEDLDLFSSPENTAGWDSLAHMNFVLELEEIFEISLSAREIMQIMSIELAVEVCGRHSER